MLEQCWNSVGTVLEQCWNSVGTVLEQCWNSVGTVLEQCCDGVSLSSLLKFFEKNIKKGGYVRKFTP